MSWARRNRWLLLLSRLRNHIDIHTEVRDVFALVLHLIVVVLILAPVRAGLLRVATVIITIRLALAALRDARVGLHHFQEVLLVPRLGA